MDIEKQLFWVHERVLSQESVSSAVKVLKIALASLGLTFLSPSKMGCGIIFLALFFYANSVHRNSKGCVGQAYDKFRQTSLNGKNLPNDTVVFINVCSYNQTAQPTQMGYYNYSYFDPPVQNVTNSTLAKTQTIPIENNDDSQPIDPNSSPTEKSDSNDNIPSDSNENTSSPIKTPVDSEEKDSTPEIVLPHFINPKQKQLRSHCLELPRIQMENTAILQSLSYPREMRVIRNITTVALYLEPSCYSSNQIFDRLIFGIIGIETILINEIIENFKYADIYVRNVVTEDTWTWSPSIVNSYETSSIEGWIQRIILSAIRINLGLFYSSAAIALYIKIQIIVFPMFILLIRYAMRCLGNNEVSISTINHMFPYIGLYLQRLRGQPSKELMKSFFKMMLLMYIMYISVVQVVSLILFAKFLPRGIEEKFLGLISILEILVLFFIRTRSSIKWFPKVSVLLLSLFLFYVQNTVYGYCSLLFITVMLFILSFFCLILEEFEIPAVSQNETFHYTPSINRPRCLYFPIFNLSWNHDLPQLWTMFYPLYGRDHFTPAQLSLVDSNYVLFNQTMDNAENRSSPNDLGIIDLAPIQQLRQGDQQEENNQVQHQQNQPVNNNDLEMQANQPQQESAQSEQVQQSVFAEGDREAARDGEEGVLLSDDSKSHEQNLLQPSQPTTQFYQGRGIQIGSNDALNRSNDSGDYQKLN